MLHLRTPLLFYAAAMLYLYITYAMAQSMSELSTDWFGEDPLQRMMRLWLYTNSWVAAGFLCFSGSRRATESRRKRRALRWGLAMSGAAGLALCYQGASAWFLPLLAVIMLGVGYFASAAHYVTAMRVKAEWRGRFLAAALTLTVLVQFILSAGGKGVPFPIALGSLAAVALLSYPCFREAEDGSCLEDEAKLAENERIPPPAPHLIALLVLLVSVLAVMHGCSDSLALAFYLDYDESLFHDLPRLFFPLGMLAAGCLADYRQRRYLLITTTLAMLLRVIGLVLFAEERYFFANLCAEYVIDSFCLMCYLLYFLDLAGKSSHPALWAGMGRTLALPLTALSCYLFSQVVEDFSMTGFVVAYVLLLMMLNLFFYHERFREWLELPAWEEPAQTVLLQSGSTKEALPMETEEKGARTGQPPQGCAEMEEPSLPGESDSRNDGNLPAEPSDADETGETVHRMEAYRQRYAFTDREMDVLAGILEGQGTADMANRLGIKERTVKYHISNILRKTGTQNQRELRLLLRISVLPQPPSLPSAADGK